MLVINDIHIGVQRKAGTTQASQEALRGFLFDSLRATLDQTAEDHLLVDGDLFDTFEVSPRDWIETYSVFCAWLAKGTFLTLVAGNHDTVERGEKMSSFAMLCRVLKDQYTNVQLVMIDAWGEVDQGVYAVAHCANQDLFDLRLGELLKQAPKFLFIHANYDNKFAAVSDHSLNVSQEWAERFIEIGTTMIFSHEHQAKTARGGKVIVLGNQFPTSVADCLGNDTKFAHTLNDGVLTKVPTWATDIPNGYIQIDWRELSEYAGAAGFIRVAGAALATEAADVIGTLAKFRQRSPAFVVTNAVAIDGIVQASELPAAFEAAKAFDVVAYIHKNLSAEEVLTFDKLLEQSA